VKRRLFLATTLAGCGYAGGDALTESPFRAALEAVERWNAALIGTRGFARIYSEGDIDRVFRTNGFDTPGGNEYTRLAAERFASYRLAVDGEVDDRRAFALPELRALASLTQITRHDCVEGWSAIGKWTGVPLGKLLALVRPRERARYVIFHCYDRAPDGTPYYESLDLAQAAHPQTVLALDLNGVPLDPDHGAPVRLRVPTQLGYKSAKWVYRLEITGALSGSYGGKGGYWEDQGYEWYAGI
jgi:DMSO/TMAO reductase YedYZ molybdopterin-dependent catalytic subunit